MHLGLYVVAGRAPGCSVPLVHHAASKNHASLAWTGEVWQVRDFGSTNGTFVNGRRVVLADKVTLARGALLRFGSDKELWELVDDGPPAAVARSLATGEVRAAEHGLLALPDGENVLVSVVMDSGGRWLVEGQDGSRRLAIDAERLTVAGQEWEIRIPDAAPVGTTFKMKAGLRLATLTLRFHVSRDDRVRLEAVDGPDTVSFGEHAFFSLLLLLAHARRKDAEKSRLPEEEHGWVHVDDLAEALGKLKPAISVDVLRVREALARAGVAGAEGIVQRRPREMRIGTAQVEEIKA